MAELELQQRSNPNTPVARDRSSAGALDRLRICYISETLFAGVGRHLMEIIRQLADRGHEIHLIHSGTRVDERLRTIIERQPNVRCTQIDMQRAIGVSDVAAFRRVQQCIAQNGPFDILHGHSSKGGGYARLLKPFSRTPIVYTPHAFVTLSPQLSRKKRIGYGLIEFGFGHLTDRLVCVSRAEFDHARDVLGIAERRLAIVPNGAEAIALPPREVTRRELGLDPRDVVVGFIGRMDEQKAPDALIAAMRLVLPDLPDVKLVMVGDGHKRPELEAGMRGLGFEDRVRWFDYAQGGHYMSAFDIMVLPSLYEGFAYVLLDALHAGLPIVATPVGGTDEAIALDENGFIVPHGSTTRMAEAIRRLAENADLRSAMGSASKNRAGQFTISRMVDGLEELYFEVVAAEKAKARRGTLGTDLKATLDRA